MDSFLSDASISWTGENPVLGDDTPVVTELEEAFHRDMEIGRLGP
jgi:hypothetical protein